MTGFFSLGLAIARPPLPPPLPALDIVAMFYRHNKNNGFVEGRHGKKIVRPRWVVAGGLGVQQEGMERYVIRKPLGKDYTTLRHYAVDNYPGSYIRGGG